MRRLSVFSGYLIFKNIQYLMAIKQQTVVVHLFYKMQKHILMIHDCIFIKNEGYYGGTIHLLDISFGDS